MPCASTATTAMLPSPLSHNEIKSKRPAAARKARQPGVRTGGLCGNECRRARPSVYRLYFAVSFKTAERQSLRARC